MTLTARLGLIADLSEVTLCSDTPPLCGNFCGGGAALLSLLKFMAMIKIAIAHYVVIMQTYASIHV